MTPHRIARFAAALALAAHLAGCGGSPPPTHPVLEDGIACGTDSSACGSGHCSDGICCRAGNCCRAPSDCPAQYHAAATCTTPGAATDCQGTRTEATCVDYTCGSAVIQDDSACSGQSRDCGAYAPVACSAAVDQPAPACGDSCTSTTQCAQGYTCDGTHCVAIAGAGQACTGTGRGTCGNDLKCENGACCGNGPATCCNAQNPCASGLTCNAVTATCGLSCTPNTSIGCADPNTYCTDGTHCAAKKDLGQPCDSAGQCNPGASGAGFCADGVCCDTACTGEKCQRCDALSAAGNGHCGWVSTKTDPDNECGSKTTVCSGQCQTLTTTPACSGTGYACQGIQVTANVPSGQICKSGSPVDVTATDYCGTASFAGCLGAEASRWYPSCDGAGSCRNAGDTTGAYRQTTKSCSTSNYTCNPATLDCFTSCTSSAQCGTGAGLKCDNGVCCGGTATCCDAQHACPSGLACDLTTSTCGVSCTQDTSTGCADSGKYCTDGAHCAQKLNQGDSCGTAAGRCTSGFCADGVCCDTACNDKACQRCDDVFKPGKGTCGPVNRGSHPDGECSGSVTACFGACQTKTTTMQCNGGYSCEAGVDTFANVASGFVCAADGSGGTTETSPTGAIHCGANPVCSGTFEAVRYRSCDGAGGCRLEGDNYGASLPVPGTDCRTTHYTCNPSTGKCLASCTTDNQCAGGWFCVTSAAPQWTCQSGGPGAPCDVPVSAAWPRGQDCDSRSSCTSAQVCRLIAGQACTVDTECGPNLYCLASPSCSGGGKCCVASAPCCD